MRRYQQTPRVHEPKDIIMWEYKDTKKHAKYMNLRIWGCQDVRIPTSTQSTYTFRIRGCEDTRLQASTCELKDMRMRGCEDSSECTGT